MNKKVLLLLLVLCCAGMLVGVAIGTITSASTKKANGTIVSKVPLNGANETKAPVSNSPDSSVKPTADPTAKPTADPTAKVDNGIDPNKPIVALSFDDGPGINSTKKILDLIEQYKVGATFFVVGDMVRLRPDTVVRAAQLGCEIANHTNTHSIDFRKVTKEQLCAEIDPVNKLVKELTGQDIKLVRPPGGAINDDALAMAEYPYILWTVDTLDWKSRNAQAVIDEVKTNVFDGAIILMHDLYNSTADACEVIIPWLLNEGYQVVSVSDMFAARGIELKACETYRKANPLKTQP